MNLKRPSWFRRGQVSLLAECLVWAFVVAAVYAGIATFSDWRRFEPETFDDYWFIISDRWEFVPDYVAWIGVPLIAIVWAHSRYSSRRRGPARPGGDEYRVFDLPPWRPRSSIETFVYLYLGAMVIAGLGRFAIIWCLMRGECGFFIWYQALLYSTVFLIWPLALLLVRHAVSRLIRRR